MAFIKNRADTAGTYNGIPVDNYSELTVELTALSIEKTADKKIWLEDELEYRITIGNIDEGPTALPVTNVELIDEIDTEIAAPILTTITVTIDGQSATPDYDYEPTTGKLTVRIGTLDPESEAVVTFQVERV